VTAIALTIAGSDSGGGAGIQADLKTFSALGVYGASVVTALTAQNTRGVQGIHDVPPAFVRAQIDSVMSDLQVGAVKIGMLSRAGVIRAVSEGLERWSPMACVLDPVMVATSGDRLLAPSAVASLMRHLMPRATVVTPNLHEAALMTGQPLARGENDMRRQAETLLGAGARAVLIKGGHGEGSESVDLLVTPRSTMRLSAPRVPTPNVHGTGCTLSSAVAAGLARGLDLAEAVEDAKRYVSASITGSSRLSVGRGNGPAHHFHHWW
jgi:hydroxymethylpyrimidine/phosphomethylpyrimidine kinase